MTTRRVLLVAYYFPPLGGSGVQRTLKFVRYLPEFGWQPVVLTARNADLSTRDETLVGQVSPDVPVVRTFIPEPYALYRRLTRRASDVPVDLAVLTLGPSERRRFTERFAEWVRSTCFIPDARVGWLPFAVLAGWRAIRRHAVNVIYTSAPPYTCHLVGWWLKRLTGLPWVADFRDSWVGWLSAPQYRPWPARRIDQALERAVVTQADWRIVAIPGIRGDLCSRTPEAASLRWRVITNGYDPADFDGVQPRPSDERLTIVYTGSLYGHRHPACLLRAIDSLRETAPQVVADLRICFVGRVAAAIAAELQREPYRDVIELVPYVPHRESVGYLLGADVLLLIVDAGRFGKMIATGKIFEYLGAQRPMLALSPPDGIAARLVRSLHAGIIADPGNPAEIAHALLDCHARWCAGTLHEWVAESRRLVPFQRRVLTGRLAEVLESLCRHSSGRDGVEG